MLEFELKGLPKTTNALRASSWRVRNAFAKKWKDLVQLYTFRHLPNSPLIKAKVTLTRCSSRESDFDGLVSSFKHVLDGLVEARILEDDKQSNIGQPTYLHEKAKQREGKIRIKVEEICT